MSVFTIRTFTTTGNQDLAVPNAQVEFTDEFLAEGYLKVTLPGDSLGASRLSSRTEVALFLDGTEVDGSRALITEKTGNPAATDDAPGKGDERVWGGKTLLSRLNKAMVYPENWPTLTPKGHTFSSATPGTIMKTLIQRAQARGAITIITHASWSSTTDSNGVAWGTTLNIGYDNGDNLLKVLDQLVSLGAVEYRMVGRDLRLYKVGTYGADRTTANPPVVLHRGRQVEDAPFSESTEELANALLVLGDNDVVLERTNSSSITSYGREEASLSQGGASDAGTLTVFADAALARLSIERGEYTAKITGNSPGWVPFVDFKVADWVYFDRDGTLNRYRIRQMSVTTDETNFDVTVTLNDKFTELDLQNAKMLEALSGGTVVTTSPSTPTPPPPAADTTIPKPPTSVLASSTVYLDNEGAAQGQVTVSWVEPTQNTDNTALTDLSGSLVYMRDDSGVAPWRFIGQTQAGDTSVSYSPIQPGVFYRYTVVAFDQTNNRSAYATEYRLQTGVDGTPPPVPSTPTLFSRMGQVLLRWDGNASGGGGMGTDFDFVEVHRSQTSGFTPSPSTMVERMYGAGQTVMPDQAYSAIWNYVLVAVDTSGNKSAKSGEAGIATSPMQGSDIIGKIISGSSNIVDSSLVEAALSGTLKATVSQIFSDDFRDPTAWVGSGALTSLSPADAEYGGYVGRATNVTTMVHATRIPFDPGELYRVTWRVRRSAGTRTISLGIRTFAGDGTTAVGASSGNVLVAASGVTIPAGAAFTEYVGYVKGVAVATGSVTGNTIETPVALINTTRYIAPLLLANIGGTGTDQQELSMVKIEVVPTGLVTADVVAANAVLARNIAAAQIGTDHLDAGAVTAEKIQLGVFTSNLVRDPSFEEEYDLDYSLNPERWNIVSVTNPSGSDPRKLNIIDRARSGRQCLAIDSFPNETNWIRSNVIPVVPGTTYILSVNLASMGDPGPSVNIRLAGGSTTALTEWPYSVVPTGSAGAALRPDDKTNTTPTESSAVRTDVLGNELQLTNLENIDVPLGNAAAIDPEHYYTYRAWFTIPAGVNFVCLHVKNGHATGSAVVLMDDVSLIQQGFGATEITAAGVRIFDENGLEIAAFVNNRPTTFSTTKEGKVTSSISQDGTYSATGLTVTNDPVFEGSPLLGDLPDYESPTEHSELVASHLNKLPRGISAYGQHPGGTTYSGGVHVGLFELAFRAQSGRTYRVTLSGIQANIVNANTQVGFYVRLLNPTWTSDDSGEAATPNLSNSTILFTSYAATDTNGQTANFPGRIQTLRCNPSGVSVGGELNGGIVKLLLVANPVGSNFTTYSGENVGLTVEDIGPDVPVTNLTNTSTAAAPQSSQPAKKTYTSVWAATSTKSYNGSNVARSDADMIQGYEEFNGNGHAIVLFTGNAISGEKTKTIASALSGATIKKVEVYLYANHWYYNTGGTALIRAHANTTLVSTTPSGTVVSSASWPKPGPRWVDITSIFTTAMRGVWVGKGTSTLKTFYGRFNGFGQSYAPQLRITYVR